METDVPRYAMQAVVGSWLNVKILVNFQAGFYGVYGRISFYRTWIEGKMTSPKFCSGTANAGA